jgi:hypothetical protein
MRRSLLFLAAATALVLAPAVASAQYGSTNPRTDRERQRGQTPKNEDPSKKADDEWNLKKAPIPGVAAAGPCPYVKILYDAARYQEFAGGRESSSAVGYTGEIEGLRAACEYKGAEPIKVRMNLLFSLGKGPAAQGDHKDYSYWVAVTFRNQAVIEKQRFSLPVDFKGRDRVNENVEIGTIVIPRANTTISGSNFEILVGFDVTPQMAEFNREGKRFRITATGTTPQQ